MSKAKKKYSLITTDTIEWLGKTLFRIKAEMSFGYVAAGEIGGYVESSKNLDQYGNAWVSGNARVSDNAWVSGNGWCFAFKASSWNVTELEVDGGVLFVKDYVAPLLMVCPDCKGDGRPLCKDGSHNGNAGPCKSCGGTGKVEQTVIGDVS